MCLTNYHDSAFLVYINRENKDSADLSYKSVQFPVCVVEQNMVDWGIAGMHLVLRCILHRTSRFGAFWALPRETDSWTLISRTLTPRWNIMMCASQKVQSSTAQRLVKRKIHEDITSEVAQYLLVRGEAIITVTQGFVGLVGSTALQTSEFQGLCTGSCQGHGPWPASTPSPWAPPVGQSHHWALAWEVYISGFIDLQWEY